PSPSARSPATAFAHWAGDLPGAYTASARPVRCLRSKSRRSSGSDMLRSCHRLGRKRTAGSGGGLVRVPALRLLGASVATFTVLARGPPHRRQRRRRAALACRLDRSLWVVGVGATTIHNLQPNRRRVVEGR